MRISDWSSDVCSSDLGNVIEGLRVKAQLLRHGEGFARCHHCRTEQHVVADLRCLSIAGVACVDDCFAHGGQDRFGAFECVVSAADHEGQRAASRSGNTTRSEEHTSELQSLMRISYAVFCLKKKKSI